MPNEDVEKPSWSTRQGPPCSATRSGLARTRTCPRCLPRSANNWDCGWTPDGHLCNHW